MLETPLHESDPMLPIPDDATLAAQFQKVKPLMTENEAVIEASRCLFCHDAPCIQACPSSIDIPMFIRQIMSRNPKGSAKTIFTQNILGKSCGEVCPTQVLCEGSCVYLDLNEKPIDIGRLQAYATNVAIENNIRFFHKGPATGKKVAVIGSGPAGLACAHELTRLGHEVVVFEASAYAGGLNRYGVAPYKFTNSDADKEVAYVSQIGFRIQTNVRIVATQDDSAPESGKTYMTFSQLEQQFDAIFLGVGLGQSRKPGIPGENLPQVYGAAEFIYQLRQEAQKIAVGRRVVVVGAGNTAIDAAVESSKLGAEVTLVYRRTPEDQSAYDFEVEHAKHAQVRLMYLTSPIQIVGTQNVEGLMCIRNEVKAQANGKSEITPIEGSEFLIPCDMVIFATGQEKQTRFFDALPGVTLDSGKVKVNADFQTSNPKIFAGGDCVNGGKEVVNAVAHGRDAARGIHRMFINTTAN